MVWGLWPVATASCPEHNSKHNSKSGSKELALGTRPLPRKQLVFQYKTQQTADSRSVCFSKPSRPELELFSNLNLKPEPLTKPTISTIHILVMELSHSYYRWWSVYLSEL